MKEHYFSIAIEAPDNQKDTLVLGRLVVALHNAGFEYQNIKSRNKQEHYYQQNNKKIKNKNKRNI